MKRRIIHTELLKLDTARSCIEKRLEKLKKFIGNTSKVKELELEIYNCEESIKWLNQKELELREEL